MKQNLTEKQQKVFDIINNYFNKHGHSPTIEELREELRANSSRTVTQYLESLEKKGFIARDRYGKRGITPIKKELYVSFDTVQIPVSGFAGCDNQSILANPIYDEYVSVSKKIVKNKQDRFMAIMAMGNSMSAAGISDGDIVLLEKTEHPENNDRVLAVVDENAVIKKIRFTENSVILSPESNDGEYKPIVMQRDFKVFGKVVDVIKKHADKNKKEHEIQIIPMTEE